MWTLDGGEMHVRCALPLLQIGHVGLEAPQDLQHQGPGFSAIILESYDEDTSSP